MPKIFPSIPTPQGAANLFWVYILQSADCALYIGQTNDVVRRIRQHATGRGSKFTRDHDVPRLVYCEGPLGSDAAIARETQLKRWSRAKKEALIHGDLATLRDLARSRATAAGR
jgi:predicted GIY-YIG superfamily endonuclease